MSEKQKQEALQSLKDYACILVQDANRLESTLPGIEKWVRNELKSMNKQLKSSEPCYLWSLQANLDCIVSRLKWTEKGLYSRIDGNKWYYAA